MSFFNKIKNNTEVNKKYSYEKNKITLSFTLRTDVLNQLNDFMELLKTAIIEVENDIKKLKIQNEYHPGAGAGYNPLNLK